MRFAGRFMNHAVIVTSLDNVPPGMRVNAAAVILTEPEAKALVDGDPVVTAQVRSFVNSGDLAWLQQMLREAGE